MNLQIIQITLSIIIVVLILLQERSSGLSSFFGGDSGGGFYHARRGLEKTIFIATIVFGIIFIAVTVIQLSF